MFTGARFMWTVWLLTFILSFAASWVSCFLGCMEFGFGLWELVNLFLFIVMYVSLSSCFNKLKMLRTIPILLERPFRPSLGFDVPDKISLLCLLLYSSYYMIISLFIYCFWSKSADKFVLFHATIRDRRRYVLFYSLFRTEVFHYIGKYVALPISCNT